MSYGNGDANESPCLFRGPLPILKPTHYGQTRACVRTPKKLPTAPGGHLLGVVPERAGLTHMACGVLGSHFASPLKRSLCFGSHVASLFGHFHLNVTFWLPS